MFFFFSYFNSRTSSASSQIFSASLSLLYARKEHLPVSNRVVFVFLCSSSPHHCQRGDREMCRRYQIDQKRKNNRVHWSIHVPKNVAIVKIGAREAHKLWYYLPAAIGTGRERRTRTKIYNRQRNHLRYSELSRLYTIYLRWHYTSYSLHMVSLGHHTMLHPRYWQICYRFLREILLSANLSTLQFEYVLCSIVAKPVSIVVLWQAGGHLTPNQLFTH